MRQRSAVARLLWEAILLRRGNDITAFRWQDLSEEDLGQAELLMRNEWAQSTTHKLGVQMLVMTNFLVLTQPR